MTSGVEDVMLDAMLFVFLVGSDKVWAVEISSGLAISDEDSKDFPFISLDRPSTAGSIDLKDKVCIKVSREYYTS